MTKNSITVSNATLLALSPNDTFNITNEYPLGGTNTLSLPTDNTTLKVGMFIYPNALIADGSETFYFPIGTTITQINEATSTSSRTITLSNACTVAIPAAATGFTFFNGYIPCKGSNKVTVNAATAKEDGIMVGSKVSSTDLTDCYVTELNWPHLTLSASFSKSAPLSSGTATAKTLTFTNGGLKITGNGGTKLHRGFYIVTDTHKGLPAIMGFTPSKALILPTYSTVVKNTPQHGFGITLNVAVNASKDYLTQPTYTIDTSYSNMDRVNYDITDWNTQPAKTASFVTIGASYGLFTCRAMDCPSLDYPRNIYICIDQMTTRNRCSNNKFAYGSVLAKIPTNQNFGNTIIYEPFNLKEIYLPGLCLDAFTVRLYDDDANPIQWNGGHWTLILNVQYNIDVGSAGLEDASMGRTYRPYLKRTQHDPLTTSREYAHKKIRE